VERRRGPSAFNFFMSQAIALFELTRIMRGGLASVAQTSDFARNLVVEAD
jgi:hypothetical protein